MRYKKMDQVLRIRPTIFKSRVQLKKVQVNRDIILEKLNKREFDVKNKIKKGLDVLKSLWQNDN